MRGACQFGPDLPSGSCTNNVSCTWRAEHIPVNKLFREDSVMELLSETEPLLVSSERYCISCQTHAGQQTILGPVLKVSTRVQTSVRGLFMPLFPIGLLAVAYYVI